MVTNSQILVVGGTGLVGKSTALQLQREGYRVRIFTRDSNIARKQLGDSFTFIQGDLADAAALERALEGCSGVHLALPSGHDPVLLERVQHQGAALVARLAARQGIQHLTYVSGYLVSERFAHIPAERAKLNAENAIRKSGVLYSIFRPTYFTDTLPRFVQGKRASIFGKQPHAIRFLTLGDFAKIVSKAHETPGANQAYFVCGPEALTFEQALRHYVELVRPDVQVSHSPVWMMQIINRLFLKGEITEILQLMAATEQAGEIGDPSEANRRFGAAHATVRDWCRQQRQ
jgi:NADH dehydrogenase